jgi:hypothetical protein
MVEKDRRTGHVYAEQDEEVLLGKKNISEVLVCYFYLGRLLFLKILIVRSMMG